MNDDQTMDDLLAAVLSLRGALFGLKNKRCFCDVGIGNPMYSGHSDACKCATKALEETLAYE